MSQPKVSIVIPVYNVERYLRQCLDSVANQTLREIQIICVDHCSKDGSLAILEEYASKNNRIQIVHCENTGGGPGQARNAAFPHIRGEYVYFVDSDDWLELTLCKKATTFLDATGADVLLLAFQEHAETGSQHMILEGDSVLRFPVSTNNAADYLDFMVAPWTKLVKLSFLDRNNIRFPEGNLPEDTFYHWAILVNNPKVFYLPEKLYHYRLRTGSQIGQQGEYVANHILVYTKIKGYLVGIGKFEEFRSAILKRKLCIGYVSYNIVKREYKPLAKKLALQSLDADDIAFLQNENNLPSKVRCFYLTLLGCNRMKYYFMLKRLNRRLARPVIKPIERLVKIYTGRDKETNVIPHARQQVAQLCGLVSQLCDEIVRLREKCNDVHGKDIQQQTETTEK